MIEARGGHFAKKCISWRSLLPFGYLKWAYPPAVASLGKKNGSIGGLFQNRATEMIRSAGENLIKRKKWLARLKIMLSAILWKARSFGIAEIDFSCGLTGLKWERLRIRQGQGRVAQDLESLDEQLSLAVTYHHRICERIGLDHELDQILDGRQVSKGRVKRRMSSMVIILE